MSDLFTSSKMKHYALKRPSLSLNNEFSINRRDCQPLFFVKDGIEFDMFFNQSLQAKFVQCFSTFTE